MKPVAVTLDLRALALAIFSFPSSQAATAPAAVAQSTPSASRIEHSESRTNRDAALEEQLARSWGLQPQEWTRYRQLMQGPVGIYSPNLDPLTALGIDAQTNDERQHYADLQVRVEARRVEKILAYQRAYDAAWKRAYPTLQPIEEAAARPINASNTSTTSNTSGAPMSDEPDGRVAVFVKENCPPCEDRVKQLQGGGRAFDLYLVGSRNEDARVRTWATHVGIDPIKVRARKITLNHDEGRWLSIGGHGDLPAVVRLIDGQWRRE